MYLHDRSDADGKCWPGIKTIAKDMKLSRSTVKRALADLEKGGYLKKRPRYRENGSRSSNMYSIQWNQDATAQLLRQGEAAPFC